MPIVSANGISICYEDEGPPDAPVMLLIMGLGMQLTAWPPQFVRLLLDAGYRVVRLDNRDSGLSTIFSEAGTPNLAWAALKHRLGLPLRSAYLLDDMARDCIALLDALSIERAHVVGASMGGMVGQLLAAQYPQRVRSFTCIMSSSGARHLPGPRREVLRMLLKRPASGREALVDHLVKTFQVIGSPAYPPDLDQLRLRVQASVQRSYQPAGTARQMVAIAASGDRSSALKQIAVPTLVIHGQADPLVPIACSKDIAAKIPGARFLPIEGMGHDLPAQLLPTLAQAAIQHAIASTASGAVAAG
ncbi:MAG: alpha/beta fold hydrolase [Burkholderiaceae bacterium]